MNEVGQKYLPIGTVVMLKGGTKRCMITGFCSVEVGQTEKMYDYSGCMYPEGFLSSEQTCLFDHEQIDKIFHMGLAEDAEEKEFKSRISSLINGLGSVTTVVPSAAVPVETAVTPTVEVAPAVPVEASVMAVPVAVPVEVVPAPVAEVAPIVEAPISAPTPEVMAAPVETPILEVVPAPVAEPVVEAVPVAPSPIMDIEIPAIAANPTDTQA